MTRIDVDDVRVISASVHIQKYAGGRVVGTTCVGHRDFATGFPHAAPIRCTCAWISVGDTSVVRGIRLCTHRISGSSQLRRLQAVELVCTVDGPSFWIYRHHRWDEIHHVRRSPRSWDRPSCVAIP